MGEFVSYLRVSTDKQGITGLGMEAQRASVDGYVSRTGGKLLTEVIEVESGTKSERKQLAEALRQCKLRKAVLLIAKLDRLARNVAFLEDLKKAKVRFVAIDMPEADATQLQMMMVFAEHEARAISARTKAALEAAKNGGAVLGRRNTPIEDLRHMGLKGGAQRGANMKAAADERAQLVLPDIEKCERAGAESYREIAEMLNAQGVKTARGRAWTAVQVIRAKNRAKTFEKK